MPRHAGAIAKTDEPEFRPAAGIGSLEVLRQWPDAAARALIIAVALILAWHTWARWGNIQIDCGRDLYVPVEILRGKVLYRDLWFPYGPLAPYLTALLIGIFGKHLFVLYCFGLGLAIGSALVLFEIGSMLEARMVGVVAALGMLFQGFGGIGGYAYAGFNYVFPWTYAGALGLSLSLLGAWMILRYVLGHCHRSLILASLFAGLALLSKPEFGAACCISLAVTIVLDAILRRSFQSFLVGAVVGAPGILMALVVYGWIFWTLGFHFMLAGNWIGLPGTYFAHHGGPELYRSIGLRFVPKEVATLTAGGAVALALWWLAGWLIARVPNGWAIATGSLFTIASLHARRFDPLVRALLLTVAFPPGMFFLGLGFLFYSLYKLLIGPNPLRVAEVGFATFALVLAVRVMAQVVPYGYSIFYDGPLFLIFAIVLGRCVTAAALRIAAEPRRRLVRLLLAAEIILLGICIIPGESRRTAPLNTSWGTVYLRPTEARVAGEVLAFIEERKQRGESVALLPELPIMYAFTGTQAPSRWYVALPGFLSPRQQGYLIADFKRSEPNYIIVTNRYTGEYGPAYFGIDYERRIYKWIQKSYEAVGTFGDFRRDGSRLLACRIYQRRRSEELPGRHRGS